MVLMESPPCAGFLLHVRRWHRVHAWHAYLDSTMRGVAGQERERFRFDRRDSDARARCRVGAAGGDHPCRASGLSGQVGSARATSPRTTPRWRGGCCRSWRTGRRRCCAQGAAAGGLVETRPVGWHRYLAAIIAEAVSDLPLVGRTSSAGFCLGLDGEWRAVPALRGWLRNRQGRDELAAYFTCTVLLPRWLSGSACAGSMVADTSLRVPATWMT